MGVFKEAGDLFRGGWRSYLQVRHSERVQGLSLLRVGGEPNERLVMKNGWKASSEVTVKHLGNLAGEIPICCTFLDHLRIDASPNHHVCVKT